MIILKLKRNDESFFLLNYPNHPEPVMYYVLVSASCTKALFHLESDNLFCITEVPTFKIDFQEW